MSFKISPMRRGVATALCFLERGVPFIFGFCVGIVGIVLPVVLALNHTVSWPVAAVIFVAWLAVDLLAAAVGSWVSKLLRLATRALDADVFERSRRHEPF
jgi:hypothetical protein